MVKLDMAKNILSFSCDVDLFCQLSKLRDIQCWSSNVKNKSFGNVKKNKYTSNWIFFAISSFAIIEEITSAPSFPFLSTVHKETLGISSFCTI